MSVDRSPSFFHTAVAQAVTGLPFSPGDVDMYVSQDQEALLALIAYLKEHFPDSDFHELQRYFNPFKSELAKSPISLVLRFSSLKMDVVISKGQAMDVVEMFDIGVAKAHFDGRTFTSQHDYCPMQMISRGPMFRTLDGLVWSTSFSTT